jgi:hypothetical protein
VVMGDTKELYASLFFVAGGLMYDLPSSDFSLCSSQHRLRTKQLLSTAAI